MRYRDEIDKCYGVAGMSVALAILDAEDLLIGVTLDGDGLDCINMVPQGAGSRPCLHGDGQRQGNIL